MRTFLALWLLALCINLPITVYLSRGLTFERLDADESEYYERASNLVAGEYDFDSRRTIGFIAILAALKTLTGGSLLAIKLILAAAFSLTVPLLHRLVVRLTNDGRAALLAAGVLALWPALVRYGGTLYSETTALPMLLAFLLLMPREEQSSRGRWIASGLLLGCLLHVRPMYLLFTPFTVLIVFLEQGVTRRAMQNAALLTVGCLMCVLPWSLFLSLRASQPILLSSNSGETLAGGLNPRLLKEGIVWYETPSGRRTWDGPGKWIPEHQTEYLTAEEGGLSRAERDRLLRERTMAWIAENPGDALHLLARKVLYMWGVYPFYNGLAQTLLGNVPIIALVILAIVGLVQLRGRRIALCRFWLLPLFVTVVALVAWGSWRFRQPGDLGLIAIVACWLSICVLRPRRSVHET